MFGILKCDNYLSRFSVTECLTMQLTTKQHVCSVICFRLSAFLPKYLLFLRIFRGYFADIFGVKIIKHTRYFQRI